MKAIIVLLLIALGTCSTEITGALKEKDGAPYLQVARSTAIQDMCSGRSVNECLKHTHAMLEDTRKEMKSIEERTEKAITKYMEILANQTKDKQSFQRQVLREQVHTKEIKLTCPT